MEPFTITTRLTKKHYSQYLYVQTYRKSGIILIILLGMLELYTGAVLRKPINYPYVTFGLFLMLSPALIVELAKGKTASRPGVYSDIQYTFSEESIVEVGNGFEATYKWEYILRLKESSHFLILFTSKQSGKFVYKDRLTSEQIAFIKSKVQKR
ncbi:MAG TPA: YcxB family protein [Chitinophagaceae bacterium]